MEIHVAINCPDEKCLERKLGLAQSFLPKGSFLHIDVYDGLYKNDGIASATPSFIDENILKEFSNYFNFEAHLMMGVEKLYDEKWFNGLYKRILLQADLVEDWEYFLSMGEKHNVEIGAVVNVGQTNLNIPEKIKIIEVLSVHPGLSGQKFNEDALNDIEYFKKNHPHATIIVDGGVDLNTGNIIMRAGARVLISASYIWDSENPKHAYESLVLLK